MIPEYSDDGEPTNLAGAASDAMGWLALLAYMMDNGRLNLLQHAKNRRRLQMAMDNLKKFMEEPNNDLE